MIVRAARRTGLFIVALFVVACVWELYKTIVPEQGIDVLGIPLAKTSDRAMPHTWDILKRLNEPENRGDDVALWRTIAGYSWYSLKLAAVGLVIGTLAGVGVAVVMARFRFAERGLLPWIVMSQTVPLIALAPQVVSWSGRIHIGGWEWPTWLSVCTLAAFLSFFPISIGTLRGLKSAPPASIELMQSYAAGWWRTLIKLRFPSAVPSMIPALKLGATLSVVGVIVSEISAGQRGGIGRAVISYAQGSTGDPTKPYAAVAGAAAIGLLLYGVVVLLDVMLMHNRPQEDNS